MKIETELTMREYDRADFPDSGEADEPVCARCFSDEDISQCIEDFNGPPGCCAVPACFAAMTPTPRKASPISPSMMEIVGAPGRTRTGTPLRRTAIEAVASALFPRGQRKCGNPRSGVT